MPAPCPNLTAALPVVLQRSAAEPALLVRCLPAEERQCLSAVELPPQIMQRLLLSAVA